MDILYIANIRLPTEKAHGIQIMKTCEALAKAGAKVELAVTDRRTPITEDPYAYYGVERAFTITRLPVFDAVGWGRLGFMLETLSFIRAANRLLRARSPEVVFGRDEQVLARLRTKAPLVWETHTGAWNAAAKRLCVRARRVIAISQGLKECYIERGVPTEKVVVAHDGVDLARFDSPLSRQEARERLGLSPRKPLVVYTGSQAPHKGVGTLRAAAKLLPDTELAVVSGRPHEEMPLFLRAADVLALPNSAKDVVSARFTSPMKLFEYLASGTPIVASDIPSLREVLDESVAILVPPDNPEALAAGIMKALHEPDSAARAARGKELAQRYGWDARAKIILEGMAL